MSSLPKSVKYLSFFKKQVDEIISRIDLFYILKEAQQKKYSVSLFCGIFDDKILWNDDEYHLSYNFNLSCGMIFNFISKNSDKIIKINVRSDDYYPLNRNIIIYAPNDIDIV